MSILDIGLLTGFRVDERDLNLVRALTDKPCIVIIASKQFLRLYVSVQLAKGHAPTISKYEMNTVLSEKGSLMIYLGKVRRTTLRLAPFPTV